MRMPLRRRRLLPALPALAVALAACTGRAAPMDIHVGRDRIEQEIAKRFPYETRWLGALDVVARAPKIAFVPERNRIVTDMELAATDRVFSRREVRGALTAESALRFDPKDGTLRLAQVSVDRFGLAGLPEAVASQSGRLGAWLAEQLLDGMVLYTASDAQKAALRTAGLEPGEIIVTNDGLTVRLVPSSR